MCPESDEQVKDPQAGQNFNTSSGHEFQFNGDSWIRFGGDLPNVIVYGGSEESESNKLIETGTSFIPFLGSSKDLYDGVVNRDYVLTALGLGGLIVDFWTLGSGSLVKGGVKSMIRYSGKELTELTVESATNGVRNTSEIHFMQSSIKNTIGNFTVLGNAEALANGTLNPNVLRMNVWKDAGGKIWTLNHRRLGAFKLSGLSEAPIQWANPSGQMWKMTTTNGGTSIKLKLGGGNNMIIKYKNMIDFNQKINEIHSKEDFVNFVELLVSNLKSNPEEWTKKTLPEYLESISSWTEDMEGYYQNNSIPIPENVDWKVFANILIAAKMYE